MIIPVSVTLYLYWFQVPGTVPDKVPGTRYQVPPLDNRPLLFEKPFVLVQYGRKVPVPGTVYPVYLIVLDPPINNALTEFD